MQSVILDGRTHITVTRRACSSNKALHHMASSSALQERKTTATTVDDAMSYNAKVESDGLRDGRQTLQRIEYEGQMHGFRVQV